MKNHLGVMWFDNKRLLIILGLFALGGIVLGIIVAFNPLLSHLWISHHLLDRNVLNVASPNRSLWVFILARFLDIFFGLLLVMLFNMTKWTMLLTFPYLGFRAFWMVINVFWIIDVFGFVHGALFAITYIIVFVVLLVVFAGVCVFALKRGKCIRMYGFKMAFRWREIKGAIWTLLIITLFIAFVEWLLYFLLLSRMVYMIVI